MSTTESRAYRPELAPAEIAAVCRRAFGPQTTVSSAVELGLGSYNSTYLVTIDGRADSVVLRAAPGEDRQFASERHFMRTEYATLPWLGVIAPLLPRVLAADWSHEVIDRDWMIVTRLDGLPAPDGLAGYPREAWGPYFRQLGAITRSVHGVRGPHFGAILGPAHDTWSGALIESMETIATDLDSLGLDASDLRRAIAVAVDGRAILDRIAEPRLLPGDLWTANLMLAEGAPEPTICGVLDLDRGIWGDPAADWTIYVASSKPGTERDAFWERDAYGGRPDDSPAATWRSQIYRARHFGAIRLERARLAQQDAVAETYEMFAALLADLDAGLPAVEGG